MILYTKLNKSLNSWPIVAIIIVITVTFFLTARKDKYLWLSIVSLVFINYIIILYYYTIYNIIIKVIYIYIHTYTHTDILVDLFDYVDGE